MKPIEHEMYNAESNAWRSLSRYKFVMFGYWAGVWVHLNRLEGRRRPNPFKRIVHLADEVVRGPADPKAKR